MKMVAIFCGSSLGIEETLRDEAYQLGQILALRNIGVVYGGSKTGLMGAMADGVVDHNGKIIGVLPAFLSERELAHAQLSELIIVDNMHQRKEKMNLLADAIIVLPGGLGTMDELFEALTWRQLGLHSKPIVLLNINGFFDNLLKFMRTMIEQGFLTSDLNKRLIIEDSAMHILDFLNDEIAVTN